MISAKTISKGKKIFTTAGFLLTQATAFAATTGGLPKVQTALEEIKTGLYAVVGVAAVIYLLWLGVMAFSEKKSWSDFGWGVVYVAAVGASVSIASWAWTLFA